MIVQYQQIRRKFRHVNYTLLLVLIVLGTFGSVDGRKRRGGHPQSRSIRVMNQCGFPVDVYWIHPETGELAESNTNGDGIMYGSETGISSYVGHEFEVREMPRKDTGQCKEPDQCRKTYISVNNNEDQCT
jgi:hypothetical protein